MDEKMHGRPVRGADEVDAFSRLHKAHAWNHRRRRYIKRDHNQRVRRGTRQALRASR